MKGSKPIFLYKVLVIACLAALAVCAIAEAHGEPFLCVKIVQARGGLRVRESPGMEAKAVYLLDDCTTVVVFEEMNGWCRVGYNSPPHAELGWVHGDYLK